MSEEWGENQGGYYDANGEWVYDANYDVNGNWIGGGEGGEEWGDGQQWEEGGGGEAAWGAEDGAGEDDDMTISVKIENKMYEAQDEPDSELRLHMYGEVIAWAEQAETSEDKNYVFQAYRGAVNIYFEWQDYPNALYYYGLMLDYVPHVSVSDTQKEIFAVLKAVGSADFETFDSVYDATREKLSKLGGYSAVLHKISMNQCYSLYASQEFKRTMNALNEVHSSLKTQSGADNGDRQDELISMYALKMKIEFQQDLDTTNNSSLKRLHMATRNLVGSVRESKSQAVLDEWTGLYLGNEGEWKSAYDKFASSFVDYQSAREPAKAQQCLQYTIMSNILLGNTEDPFVTPEAQALKNNAEIRVFIDLTKSFKNNDVTLFSKCLKIIDDMKDKFVSHHLETMVWDFHSKAIFNIVQSYKKIKLIHLAENLNIDVKRCQRLVIALILDQKISGKIDQVKGLLDLSGGGSGSGGNRYVGIDKWCKELGRTEMPRPVVSMFGQGLRMY